ncbi:MAG: SMC family ATPase [bacterium]|nr:SMC family ATPase [bacterium]
MKVRRLAFRALGPYPGEHVIDFDSLSVSGLFLLCGPTGTGKSTVIDAITFALYGSIEGDKDRLHSDHAADGVEPYAELVFETASGLYRVRRSPAYERKKLRGGEGTTTVNPQARLVRLTSEDQIDVEDAGEAMSAQVSEVGAEVGGLVGLSKEQFLQTIVLPQGQFARFLTTKPDERQRLLQTIFNTQIYQDTQEYLRTESVRAERTVDGVRRKAITALVSLWAGREGMPEIGEATWEDTGRVREAGTELVAGIREDAERLGAAAAAAKGRADTAHARFQEAEKLSGLLRRRQAAHAVLAAQEERAEEIAEHRERLRRATAAAGLRSTLRRAAETAEAERAAEAAVAAAHAAAGEEVAALEPAALDQQRDSLRSRVDALQEARQVELRVATQEAELEKLAAVVERESAAQEGFRGRLDAIPAERDGLRDQHAAATAAAARMAGHDREVARIETLRATATRLGRVEAETEAARTAAERASDAAEAAGRHEAEVRESWLGGIAGDLAAELVGGAACMVCGSTEHPSPASRAEGSADKAAAEAARTAHAAATDALAAALTELSRLTTQADELRSQLGTETADSIAAALTRVREAQAEDRARADQAESLSTQLSALAESEKELGGKIEAARAAAAEATSSSARITGELDMARTAVEKARGAHASLAEALEAGELALSQVEAVRTALTDARSAREQHTTVAAGLEEVSRDAGFADSGEAGEALLPQSELEQLSRALEEVDSERASAIATLAEAEISALTGSEEPRVEDRRAEWQEAVTQSDDAATRLGAARRDVEEAERCLQEFTSALDEEAATAEGVRALVRMAKVVRGENSRSMRLTTYVLLRRFEDVVRAANIRLAAMSDGRYELRRADEEGGQRARGQGLGLEVMDYITGKVRSPHTLSGGETFYTSLSLALGLADVVTDETGGIKLGTLFVDEGFGTLDPDTLENVMGVLQSLSDGGRAVGIVSHVTELRNQIHEQIQVNHRTDGAGSTLTVVA